MTWAEQLRQQGKQQGIAERDQAEQQRRVQQVLRMLRLKFGEVDETSSQHVQGGSIDQLECWTERILIAENCEDVFKD